MRSSCYKVYLPESLGSISAGELEGVQHKSAPGEAILNKEPAWLAHDSMSRFIPVV